VFTLMLVSDGSAVRGLGPQELYVRGFEPRSGLGYTGCLRGECATLRGNVVQVKLHRYNQKHLHPKLNGYIDKDEAKFHRL